MHSAKEGSPPAMLRNQRIYLVDDEPHIRSIIRSFLLKEGYQVEAFSCGEDLLCRFQEQPSDLVILDVMLPGMDGVTLCSALRGISAVPVILVSALDGETERIAGLRAGGDDYLCKPFSPLELVARVQSLFRRRELDRAGAFAVPDLQVENVRISSSQHQVFVDGRDAGLSNMEFSLVLYLASRENRAVGRKELLAAIWGFNELVETRATDDMMKRVRKKLDEAGARLRIRTMRGYGFMLESYGTDAVAMRDGNTAEPYGANRKGSTSG